MKSLIGGQQLDAAGLKAGQLASAPPPSTLFIPPSFPSPSLSYLVFFFYGSEHKLREGARRRVRDGVRNGSWLAGAQQMSRHRAAIAQREGVRVDV